MRASSRIICPVVELGLAGATMHKTDECVARERRSQRSDRHLCARCSTAYFAEAARDE